MLNNTNLPKAYVTLVTNNSYVNGAIVLGYSLRNYNTTNLIICLVTSEVDSTYRAQLTKIFDHVIEVPKLDSQDSRRLGILGRPELGVTFSKLNVWNMTWLSQILFLDADTLVLKNIDHLFSQYENTHFAACPDIGWPDCFNSGVFMCKPSHQIYSDLIKLSKDQGSFDGGDQGLLNIYFNTWSKDQNQRIPFTYNVTPNAVYSYTPAYEQYQNDISVLHFIGNSKPWNQNQNPSHNSESKYNRNNNNTEKNLNRSSDLVHRWWEIFNQLPHEIAKQTNTVPPVNQDQDNKEKNYEVEEKAITADGVHHHTSNNNENYSRHPFDNIFKNPKQEPPHISSLPDNYFRPLESPPSTEDQHIDISPNIYDSLDNYQLLTDARQISKDEPFPLFEAYKEHVPKRQSQKRFNEAHPPNFLTPNYHRLTNVDIKPNNDECNNSQPFKLNYQAKQTSRRSNTPLSSPTSPRSKVKLLGTKFNRSTNESIITDKGTYLTEYKITVESDSPIDDNYLKFEPSFENQEELQLSLINEQNDPLAHTATNDSTDSGLANESKDIGLQSINTPSINNEPSQFSIEPKNNETKSLVTQDDIIDDVVDVSASSHPVQYNISEDDEDNEDNEDDEDNEDNEDDEDDEENNKFSDYRIYWDQPQLKNWRPPAPKTAKSLTPRKSRESSQSDFTQITFALDNLKLQLPKSRRASMKRN